MPRDLFAVPAGDPSTRRSRRLIPVSIALHVLALAVAIVVPLLAVGELPPVADSHPMVLLARPVLPRVEVVPAPPRPARVPQRAEPRLPGPERPSVNIAVPEGIRPETDVDTGVPDWLPQGGGAIGLGDLPGPSGGGIVDGAGVAPSDPIPVGGNIQRPRRLHHVAPAYPPIAQAARVEGDVVIDAIIGPDGVVRQATVRRSDNRLLDQAALDAVRQWTYTPTRLNGVPVAVVMSVEVRFRLGR